MFKSLKTHLKISAGIGLIASCLCITFEISRLSLVGRVNQLPPADLFSYSLIWLLSYAGTFVLCMVTLSILFTILLKIGEYNFKFEELLSLYIGLTALAAISTGLGYLFFLYVLPLLSTLPGGVGIPKPLLGIITILVSILSGAGAYFLSLAVLKRTKKITEKNLLPLCSFVFISFIFLMYSGIWLNLPGITRPALLLLFSNLLLVLTTIFLFRFLYQLTRRRRTKKIKSYLRQALGSFIILFLVIALSQPRQKKIPLDLESAPNILFIVMDAARTDHFSCYGYHRTTTPRIDELASGGAVFENAIAQSSWTLPSHASMFTGLFVSEHLTNINNEHLKDEFLTLAEILKKHGYATLGYSNNTWVSRKYNLTQGFTVFHEYIDILLRDFLRKRFLISDYGARNTNVVVRKWIKKSHRANQPFFIFINYMEPHAPYGDTPYRKKFRKNLTRKQLDEINELGKILARQGTMSRQQQELLVDLYDADLLYNDFRVGELTDYLKKLGILDQTLVIITADHGEHLGDHDLVGHGNSLYDALIRIPLIIRYPAKFGPGTRIENQFSHIELMELILGQLGIEGEMNNIPGINVPARELLHAEKMTLSEMWRPVIKILRQDQKLKYIKNKTAAKEELYDIPRDPDEINDLMDKYPREAKRFVKTLDDLMDLFFEEKNEERFEGEKE